MIGTKFLAQVTAAALLTGCFASAEAQHRNHGRRNQVQGYYAVPGMSMRIYPPPRRIYRFGGTTIYQGRYSNPWPYGAPRGYVWPYGNTFIYPPGQDHRWKNRPRGWR